MSPYTPQRGDVVWLNFTPQAGHEQSGRRPGLVLSPMRYNSKVGLMLACPITSRAKGYPFEVKIPDGMKISGVVLSDQLRCLDWRERKAEFIVKVDSGTLDEVRGKIDAILHDEG
jgi:mRNA interferase MazF